MYLKSLEIQGFKSFPDKTVLQFGSDCTAIVGPNGSGKSNISDAISWVLGEQSTKALRGAKMEDVIFGGTAKRPAVGYAEATLVLDNSDGCLRIETPEVMITRRYFRSGESEYYINRQLARLRDINELFMDTGLGREGYSNIGQGRIDEILALKSTDRREIFEEAAGISKYRHRKEDTERRLANTEDNLLRIGDAGGAAARAGGKGTEIPDLPRRAARSGGHGLAGQSQKNRGKCPQGRDGLCICRIRIGAGARRADHALQPL